MEPKTTGYCLLVPIPSVEKFLKLEFKASASKLKKYFSKAFLNKRLSAKSMLVLPLDFLNDGEINPCYFGDPIEILYEDEFFFVFNKNPNQFVHPLCYGESDNCLSYIRQERPALLNVNRDHYDRGLLYRLDYETSGVVVYVKSDALYKSMRDNFSKIAHEKNYWCWVEGECLLKGDFKNFFSAGEEKGRRVLVSDQGGEKDRKMMGELSLKAIRHDLKNKMTLLEVSLKTGLRHQIRAQLAHLGHPLVGDTFYGGREASRLYLHAVSYHLKFLEKSFVFSSKPSSFNGL